MLFLHDDYHEDKILLVCSEVFSSTVPSGKFEVAANQCLRNQKLFYFHNSLEEKFITIITIIQKVKCIIDKNLIVLYNYCKTQQWKFIWKCNFINDISSYTEFTNNKNSYFILHVYITILQKTKIWSIPKCK